MGKTTINPEIIHKRYQKHLKEEAEKESAFLNLRSLLGNRWAVYFAVLASEQSGKSYAAMKLILNLKKRKGDQVKVYWFRMSDSSCKKLLESNGARSFDADLVRKYQLDLKTRGSEIYDQSRPELKLPMMTVLPLSTVASQKGVAYYDKDYTGEYLIICDEFERDTYSGERKTFKSISYNLRRAIENVARATGSKSAKGGRIRVLLLGNTLSEASEVLVDFGFIPDPGAFGRYKIRNKKLIIDYVKPSKAYLRMRTDAAVELLTPANMSSKNNAVDFLDQKLLNKHKGTRPVSIIKFTDKSGTWYTVWDNGVIAPYNKETIKNVIPMRRYIQNTIYNQELVNNVIQMYDTQSFRFYNYFTYAAFKAEMIKIKPQR